MGVDAHNKAAIIVLLLLGVALSATVVPAPFTIDENHYLTSVLALREGHLLVPGTEGLTPSRELLWFDPAGPSRVVTQTPVSTSAPPLYAFFALPFCLLGWRGLVALNTLAFMGSVWLVLIYTRRHARNAHTAPLAAVTFALGGYSLDYAQGLWPHSLATFFVLAAAVLADRVRDENRDRLALAAGVLAGCAVGIRYQNILVVGCLGLGLLTLGSRRWRNSLVYGAGAAIPVAACSVLNAIRLGSWNPVSKGPGYLPTVGAAVGDETTSALASAWSAVENTATMAWARIVDYSVRPPLVSEAHAYMYRDSETGSYLIGGTMKKAWLQSSPWIVIGLVASVVAWRWWGKSSENGARREIRALSLVVFPVLLMFAASGLNRTDGLNFNQRYFLELVPLVAIVFAWSLDRWEIPRRAALFGAAGGLVFAELALHAPNRSLWLLTYWPLAMAAALLLAWIAIPRARDLAKKLLFGFGAASIVWSAVIHVQDDISATRAHRQRHAAMSRALDRLLPAPPTRTALVTHWGFKDAAGPLLFDRDLVIVETRADDGATAPTLVEELLADGRRVFVKGPGYPIPFLLRLAGNRQYKLHSDAVMDLLEILPTTQATAASPTADSN